MEQQNEEAARASAAQVTPVEIAASAPSSEPTAQQAVPGTAAPLTVQPSMGDQASQGHTNGLVLPNQDATFAALQQVTNANGAIFPDPSMLMMPSQQMMGLNGLPVQPVQPAAEKDISADEIALYDRQIRLWGMDAQKKIQGANILLITLRALGNEIAKNLVLAGVGSLTIVDDEVVAETDTGAQFFLSEAHIGQNRALAAVENIRKLNPRVNVFADSEGIMKKGASFFAAYNIIIATDLSPTTLAFINTATRLHGRQFYAAATHGMYGYIFCDLIEHDYVIKREKANVSAQVGQETRTRSITDVKIKEEGGKKMEMISKREMYSTWDLAAETSLLPSDYTGSKRRLRAVSPTLSCLRALWIFQTTNGRYPSANRQDLEFFTKQATQAHQMLGLATETLKSDFLRSFLQNIGCEIAPVTAILGGQLAQDVINVLGQNQPPIQNMVIFDGNKMQGDVYPLHPEHMNLGNAQLDLAGGMGVPVPMVDPAAAAAMYGQMPMMPDTTM